MIYRMNSLLESKNENPKPKKMLNGINWLIESKWPDVITLNGTYCITIDYKYYYL